MGRTRRAASRKTKSTAWSRRPKCKQSKTGSPRNASMPRTHSSSRFKGSSPRSRTRRTPANSQTARSPRHSRRSASLKPGSTRTITQKKKISNKKRPISEKAYLNMHRNLASELAQERQEKQTKEDKIKTIYEKLMHVTLFNF